MTRWLSLAALVLAAGCDVCPVNTVEMEKFASVSQFHDDIVACTNQRDCDRLCLDVFQLGPDDSLESCAITKLVPAGGVVHVRYTEAQTCGADGDLVVLTGDGSTDDGSSDCSDGSCDPPDDGCSDGSCDPPPDDPCSDGSCDPPPDDGGGSTDDGGGGDDGTDDGSSLRKIAPTSPISRPAS